MALELGNRTEDSVIHFKWSTNAAAGGSITRATNGTVSVYKDDNTTQTTAGVTDTEDHDSNTGVHHCKIDTSADAFYEVDKDYDVVLVGATIDGQTVNQPIAHFRIEKGFNEVDVVKLLGQAVATPTVAGVQEVDVTHNLGVAATGAAGRLEVNASHLGGSAIQQASGYIKVSEGTGTGQLDLGSGKVKLANVAQTILSLTASDGMVIGSSSLNGIALDIKNNSASSTLKVSQAHATGHAAEFNTSGGGIGFYCFSNTGFGCEYNSNSTYAFACDGGTGAIFTGQTTYGLEITGPSGAIRASSTNGSVLEGTSGGNVNCVDLRASGSGAGVFARGGSTGHGMLCQGGSTSGDGLRTTVTSGAKFSSAGTELSTLTAGGVRTELTTELGRIDVATSTRLVGTTTGSGFTAIPWNSAWDTEVQSEVEDGLDARHLNRLFHAAYDPANKPGNASGLWNILVENDGGTPRFTANSLEQAPSGGGGSGDWTSGEKEQIRGALGITGTASASTGTGTLDKVYKQTSAQEE